MDSSENLVLWAEDNGVELNGIKPQRIPGRGLGVIATCALKVSDQSHDQKLFDSDNRQEKSSS